MVKAPPDSPSFQQRHTESDRSFSWLVSSGYQLYISVHATLVSLPCVYWPPHVTPATVTASHSSESFKYAEREKSSRVWEFSHYSTTTLIYYIFPFVAVERKQFCHHHTHKHWQLTVIKYLTTPSKHEIDVSISKLYLNKMRSCHKGFIGCHIHTRHTL